MAAADSSCTTIARPVCWSTVIVLQWPEHRAAGTLKRGALVAAAIAVTAGCVIAFLFQYVFLVRLP